MHATTNLPASTTSPGVARAWARQLLAECCADLVDTADLVISELVTNAIVHARSEVTVRLSCTTDAEGRPELRIDVSDLDSRLPRFETVDLDALGGRGLALVQSMALGFGVDVDDYGKTVWAHLVSHEDVPDSVVPAVTPAPRPAPV